MKSKLSNIASFQSGIYEKPGIDPDTLYLQAVHFLHSGEFDKSVQPALKLNEKLQKHLLKEGDLLFAAKGLNNFAAVYKSSIGKAVASSSFIVIKIHTNELANINPEYLAWYINHNKQIKLLHEQQLGTTIPSISMKQLAELEIEIPSVSMQEKIVTIQNLREKEKELTLQLEDWKDKYYQHLFNKAITK
jgi:restriction endonuclease S subunit